MNELTALWFVGFPILSITIGLIVADKTDWIYFWVVGIMCFVIWCFGLDFLVKETTRIESDFEWVVVDQQNVYAINDTTNTNGNMGGGGNLFGFVMRGYIQEKWQYVFYIKNGEVVNMRQADVTNTNIIERNGEQPKEIVYKKKIHANKLLWFNIKEQWVEEYYNDIIVPVGSVVNGYQLDLQK